MNYVTRERNMYGNVPQRGKDPVSCNLIFNTVLIQLLR